MNSYQCTTIAWSDSADYASYHTTPLHRTIPTMSTCRQFQIRDKHQVTDTHCTWLQVHSQTWSNLHVSTMQPAPALKYTSCTNSYIHSPASKHDTSCGSLHSSLPRLSLLGYCFAHAIGLFFCPWTMHFCHCTGSVPLGLVNIYLFYVRVIHHWIKFDCCCCWMLGYVNFCCHLTINIFTRYYLVTSCPYLQSFEHRL